MPIEIEKIPLFHGFSPSQIGELRKCLIAKSFRKGAIIHTEDAFCTHLFFVRSGSVKIYKSSPKGKEQIYEILGPGGTCACNAGGESQHCPETAEALEPTEVWFLSRENYTKMIQSNPALIHSLSKLFTNRLACFTDLIAGMAFNDSKKRLIKFFLDMIPVNHSGEAKKTPLYLPFTREQIAQRLGLARETVARQISDLKRKKLIEVKPYQIIILDQKALQKLLQ